MVSINYYKTIQLCYYLQEKYGGTIMKKKKMQWKNQFKWNLNGKYTNF
jgi:hypothetical protein